MNDTVPRLVVTPATLLFPSRRLGGKRAADTRSNPDFPVGILHGQVIPVR